MNGTGNKKFDVMASAPWNVLDHTGKRIAWCGYDGDHESTGPAIAKRIADALNAVAHYEVLAVLLEIVAEAALAAGWEKDVPLDEWVARLASDHERMRTELASMIDLAASPVIANPKVIEAAKEVLSETYLPTPTSKDQSTTVDREEC